MPNSNSSISSYSTLRQRNSQQYQARSGSSDTASGSRDDRHENVFLKGAGLSMYQSSGGIDTNWNHWEAQSIFHMKRRIKNGDRCGISNNFWDNYEEDIRLASQIGCNSLMISFEWDRLEPTKGFFNKQAIQRYHRILDAMEHHSITPLAVLHQHTHPHWFDLAGGFFDETNAQAFVKYAVQVFKLYGTRVSMWATFYAPNLTVFYGYILGTFPPGIVCGLYRAGLVLRNMLSCHTRVYQLVKELPVGRSAHVGLIVGHEQWTCRAQGLLGMFVSFICGWLNRFVGCQVIADFFVTGQYRWSVPVIKDIITYSIFTKPPPIDWVGISYIKSARVNSSFKPDTDGGTGNRVQSDSGWPLDVSGLERAINFYSRLSVPMYITGTGVADATGSGHRFMQAVDSIADVVEKSVSRGYDVRGLYLWTLVDGFEWNLGYSVKYGLYELKSTGARGIRSGVGKVVELFSDRWPTLLSAFQSYATRKHQRHVNKEMYEQQKQQQQSSDDESSKQRILQENPQLKGLRQIYKSSSEDSLGKLYKS